MGALVSQHILVLLGDGTKITVHTVIWGKRSQEADMGNTVVQQGEGSHLGREISFRDTIFPTTARYSKPREPRRPGQGIENIHDRKDRGKLLSNTKQGNKQNKTKSR